MSPRTSGEPIRILLVDDHPVLRHGLRSLLAGHPDLEVVGEAENGAEVLPFLAANRVDVILLDIKMKGATGIEVARRVLRSYENIRIIILTTYDDESYLHKAIEAGVSAYLLKSVSHEILPDTIRAVMRGEKVLSPSLVGDVMSNYQRLAQEQALREAGLSRSDLQLLRAIADGENNRALAGRFYWSEATVKRKVGEILQKLSASNRAQAIAEAVRRGWI